MSSYETETQADAVQAVAGAICRGAGEVLAAHGDDPETDAILIAGFMLAIDLITEHINPAFRDQLKMMMEAGK